MTSLLTSCPIQHVCWHYKSSRSVMTCKHLNGMNVCVSVSALQSLESRQNDVHRCHYQFSAEDWRLNFLSGLTAVLPHEHLTVLTTTWPHITVTCPCSPRTLCRVKSIRYHHHQNTLTINLKINVANWRRYWWYQTAAAWVHVLYIKRYCHLMSNILQH